MANQIKIFAVMTLILILVSSCTIDQFAVSATVTADHIHTFLPQIESKINEQHITYRSVSHKLRKDLRHTFALKNWFPEEIYKEVYSELYAIDQAHPVHTPILYDLHDASITDDTLRFTSSLYLGTKTDRPALSDPCGPFVDDYYIGWEVNIQGQQDNVLFNSKCDGSDEGHSAFQRLNEVMGNTFEIQQPPIHKGELVFSNVAYFDLKFENNTFSQNDYMQVVTNCIGKSIHEFLPSDCVKFYDLNCLYCDLMPLIEAEIEDVILPQGSAIALFYIYFGYNSTSLDNNSMGYGLCYGKPSYLPPGPTRTISKERCFCDEMPRTEELSFIL